MEQYPLQSKNLPHLAYLFDSHAVAQAFQALFDQEYSLWGFTVEDCEIEKISYRPDKRCGVLYRLFLHDRVGSRFDQWFWVKMVPPGKVQAAYEKECAFMTGPSSLWKPVSLWPEWDTVVLAFPYDQGLPQLPSVVHSHTVARLVEKNAGVLGLGSHTICRQVRCRRVKYVPAKRCVLQFEVDVSTSSARQPGREQTVRFFSKTFQDEESRYVFDTLRRVRDCLSSGAGQFEIPAVLVHLDEFQTFWQAAWPGISMADLYGRSGWETILPRVAQGLAAFHLSKIEGLKTAVYTQKIVSEATGDASWIGDLLPDQEETVLELSRQIETLEAEAFANPVWAVPIHGAFRMSQLLVNGNRIAMVDLDAIALGDPLYDVAEFMSSIIFQFLRRELPLGELAQNAVWFSELYTQHVPWSVSRPRLAWYMAALLVGKFRGILKRTNVPTKGQMEELLGLVAYYLEQVTQPEEELALL